MISAKVSRVVFDLAPSFLTWAAQNPYATMKIASDSVLLQVSGQEKGMEIEQRIKVRD
ncbi:MAG: hypothetical protein JSV71_02660 [Nitrospiraceae bacterium]|nr:MAG: hypothetical protein JSV71_02660 [Nitrospiraceae bacterium]